MSSTNTILDIGPKIKIGNAVSTEFCTGVTVLVSTDPDGLPAAVDQRGGSPGTRELAPLDLHNSVGRIHAIVLTGGSIFGLAAASSVASELSRRGYGIKLGPEVVPIVPSVVIYDPPLYSGKNEEIYRQLGLAAIRSALDPSVTVPKAEDLLGSVGAGYSATTCNVRGGLGTCSWKDPQGWTVGVILVNNCAGNTLLNNGPRFNSYLYEMNQEFGGIQSSKNELHDGVVRYKHALETSYPFSYHHEPGSNDAAAQAQSQTQNTVIGVIAVNLALSRSQLKRIAIMAHDGLSMAIHPSHTPFDGDTLFAVSTCDVEGSKDESHESVGMQTVLLVGARAAECVSRACARAVFCASENGSHSHLPKSYKQMFGHSLNQDAGAS